MTATLVSYLQQYIDSGEWILQYQIDGVDESGWQTYDSSTGVVVSENCTIYFRLTDGIYSGNYTSATITNIVSYTIADTETSYASTSSISYYADVDGDGEVDGIIYADLAFTKEGYWSPAGHTGAYITYSTY